MKVPRKSKAWVAVLVAFCGVLVAWMARRDPGQQTAEPSKSATSPADFDFYLLAMTLHPAFCADGHARKPECRAGRTSMLSIHGLWPERLAPGEYPRDCPGPRLDLEPQLAQDLAILMPGMADGLHEHEWRAHGTCSGLGDDEYFLRTLELAHSFDAVFREHLTTLAGRSTSAAGLRAFADRQVQGYGETLTFHCRTLRDAPIRGEPYLVEIRQCVQADGVRGQRMVLMNCAEVQRRDQGCGRSFHIAGPP